MQHVDVNEVDVFEQGGGSADVRGLSNPLNTSDVAINHYQLEPGESFSPGMHAHLDQEELFYVVEGEATFEHKAEPTDDSETTTVGAGEAIRFPAGEYQQGRNEGSEEVVALALGAPPDSEEGRVPRPCPECDADALAVVVKGGEMGLECPECGTSVSMGPPE